MKVFLAGTSFLPSYGGPARSVSQLAQSLCSLGATVGIWAPDGSALSNTFLPPDSTVSKFGGAVPEATEAFGKPDLIHDNGIWLPHNHSLAVFSQRRGIPRVVSTRGMLEPWSWQHKRLKKVIAWYAYQRRDLKACASIHATSEMEAKTISKLGLKCPTWTIPNGIVWPEQVPSLRKTKILQNGDEHTRTAVFLGRLYPVKGLPLLLDAWAKVRPSGWQLKLVGPDEANHADLLKQLIKKLNLSGVVFLVGPLEGHDKWRTLYSSDLFVCPSYTENFGMAIAEAMACGLPVITTTGTPWKSIADQGLGWWVPPEPDSLSQALAESTRCTTSELSEMGERARAFVSKNFAWKEIGNTMLTKYQALCDNRNAGWVKKHGIYGR